MGYSDLPNADTGSALYVLAFGAAPNNSSSHQHQHTTEEEEEDSQAQPYTSNNTSAAGSGVAAAAAAAAARASRYSVWSVAGPASLVFRAAAAGSCYRVIDMLGTQRPGKHCVGAAGGLLRVDNVTDAPILVIPYSV